MMKGGQLFSHIVPLKELQPLPAEVLERFLGWQEGKALFQTGAVVAKRPLSFVLKGAFESNQSHMITMSRALQEHKLSETDVENVGLELARFLATLHDQRSYSGEPFYHGLLVRCSGAKNPICSSHSLAR